MTIIDRKWVGQLINEVITHAKQADELMDFDTNDETTLVEALSRYDDIISEFSSARVRIKLLSNHFKTIGEAQEAAK